MKAFIILFSSDTDIAGETVNTACKAIFADGRNVEIYQTMQLSDEEVANILVKQISTQTEEPTMRIIANTIPKESEVKAAGEYLVTNFGDPDNEDSFRIRVQMAVRSWNRELPDYMRLMNAIEIFSKLHNKKLTVLTNAYLRDTGLIFMKSFANSLIRMKDL